jgi:hypothetical protein
MRIERAGDDVEIVLSYATFASVRAADRRSPWVEVRKRQYLCGETTASSVLPSTTGAFDVRAATATVADGTRGARPSRWATSIVVALA